MIDVSIFLWLVRCWGERKGKGGYGYRANRVERVYRRGHVESERVLWAVCTKKKVLPNEE